MSSFGLKLLACIFMLIDHIGFALLPKCTLLRVIGRLAFPIFAYQLSVGFDKTKNKEKYVLRMLIFTVVSQLPFYLMRKNVLSNYTPMLNIGATLTCGLLALYCLDKIKNPFIKYLSVLLIIIISAIIPMDYVWYGVLAIVIFYIFRNNKLGIGIFYSALLISYCIIKKSVFNLPAIYALLPILLFNGKKGKDVKYFFYVFYPLHMLLIVFIKVLCF